MSNKLGEKIKEIRLENGMSQEEFAKELGYTSKSTITKLEKGVNDISYDKLQLLIQKFDLEVNELFDNLAKDMGSKVIKEDRTERVELTVLCLVEDGNKILLQNKVKKDWQGYTLPGGHVERVKENRTELHPSDEDDFENITLSNDSADEPEIM